MSNKKQGNKSPQPAVTPVQVKATKPTREQRHLKQVAADKYKVLAVPKGMARAVRRWEEKISKCLPKILQNQA